MPSAALEALAAAGLLLAQPAGAGQPFTPRSELEEALGRPKRLPEIPPELRAMVRVAEPDRIVLRALDGSDIAIDLTQREPERFAGYGGGRFFGFPFVGYEFFGFTLVDRAATGDAALIETGEAPVFSADGRYFAAASMSEGGFGGLEGMGLWEVTPQGVVQRFFTDAVPRAFDWRVDGWPRADCAAVTAIDIAWEPPAGIDYGEAVPSAPRMQFQIEIGEAGGIALRRADGGSICGVVPTE